MSSFKKDPVGFYQEPTTYRYDFCSYPPQPIREINTAYPADNPVPNKSSVPLNTIRGHDTLQQLDYKMRLPFNAMLRPKEIVGMHPQETFCRKNITDDGLHEAVKTRPRLYVSPGISLDNVGDRDTRKLMVDFTYKTTTGTASKEAWAHFHPIEPCLPNTVFEKTVNPLALHLQLLPDIPAGFQAAARKWDSIQERYQMDGTEKFLEKNKNTDYADKLAKLISDEEKDRVRSLLKENRVRLPYYRMPLSYGGFRPQIAAGVPLEKKML